MANKLERTRNYATLVYLESAPADWLDRLKDLHIPFFVSPLHDRDLKEDGTPKKPHHHVQLIFDGVKTKEQAEKIFAKIGGVGCEVLESQRGYARYLCHLDDPDKAQYNVNDVIFGSGADYFATIGTMGDKFKCIREMRQFIIDYNIFCFCDLFDYACMYNTEWLDALSNNCSYIIREYIKSYAWKHRKKDEDTDCD